MSMTAPQILVDPLRPFMSGAFVAGTKRPIPLIATRFDVKVNRGLAVVSATRTFKNAEDASIEATITFPVPVHAALFSLEARIGERVLRARARRKGQARENYEDAIERGKTAVLHEEVLRGVHMLSVAHIPPGGEVEVSATWTVTLTNLNGHGRIRIPLTVGDIYGCSGLPDSDELISGGPLQAAELNVHSADGKVTLIGGMLIDGRARVPLNAPIDLGVSGWAPGDLRGRAADGRSVVLRIEPAAAEEAAIHAAVLVDHSGSMGEACSADDRNLTKHQAVAAGLQRIAHRMGAADVLDVWQFSDSVDHVGSARGGKSLDLLVPKLSPPAGGTQIGSALNIIIGRSHTPDVLLVTDGKSHALDVQALARTGRRFCVVLVGEDSLEANVGNLAAMTGGEIFVTVGSDLADVLEAAVRSLRRRHVPLDPIAGKPQHISVHRSGMVLTASWRGAGGPSEETAETRAVAALAASLAFPALDGEGAAQLAEAEGLVTHLTSLVLIDEAAVAQEGIPAARKVILPAPRTSPAARAFFQAAAMSPFAERVKSAYDMRFSAPPPVSIDSALYELAASDLEIRWKASDRDLSRLGAKIDWPLAPHLLQAGDLSTLDSSVAEVIREAARIPEVVAIARRIGCDPTVFLIALIARGVAPRSRSAGRIAKAILGGIASEELDNVARMLGLAT